MSSTELLQELALATNDIEFARASGNIAEMHECKLRICEIIGQMALAEDDPDRKAAYLTHKLRMSALLNAMIERENKKLLLGQGNTPQVRKLFNM